MCTCAFSMQQFPSSQAPGGSQLNYKLMNNVQSMYKLTNKQGVVDCIQYYF